MQNTRTREATALPQPACAELGGAYDNFEGSLCMLCALKKRKPQVVKMS